MTRVAPLVVAMLALAPPAGLAQPGGSSAATPRCSNCEDPVLLAWLQPLDPQAERFACALEIGLTIESDGRVSDAVPSEEAPTLCASRAAEWARATRWEVAGSTPVRARLPLAFEIQAAVEPRCAEHCAFTDILEEVRRVSAPRASGDTRGGYERPMPAGFHCEPVVGIRIDEAGEPMEVKILEGGENVDCARAARRWAIETRWTPAFRDGEPAKVWISQRLRISTGR